MAEWVPHIRVLDLGSKITENFESISILLDKPGMQHLLMSCVYKPPRGTLNELVIINYLK